MGEYQEDYDCNDLLEGGSSDEDSEVEEDVRGKLLNINEMTISCESSSSARPDVWEHDLPAEIELRSNGEFGDSDEEDENTKDKEEEEEQSLQQKQQLLHSLPPGIRLFRGETFRYFSQPSLSLEEDFQYSRRVKLLSHGFSHERITEMLTDPWEFVRHLFPEAQSVLICDAQDYRAVMDFLFYSISVCTENLLRQLLTKAFFDLRRNYGFKWYLTLQHVIVVMLNLGADPAAVLDTKLYQAQLQKHIDAVRNSGQNVKNTKYQLPELPTFIKRREKQQSQQQLQEGEMTFCLEQLLVLLADFSGGQPDHLGLRYKENWSDQIIFLYLLLLTATDSRLVGSYQAREAVNMCLHYHLDSFKPQQWYWGPDRRDRPTTADGHKDFNHSNVCKSLIVLLNEFVPGERCPDTVSWTVLEDHASKVSFSKNNVSDHHLNMLHRLSLIPPTCRGNQLKKYLAFICLQTMAEIRPFVLPPHVNVFDITDTPELCDELSPGLKLLVKAKNYDCLMSVVELYDIVIGHEPSTDFTEDKVEAVQQVERAVLAWMQRKMPTSRGLSLEDRREIRGMQLTEYLDIVISRVQNHCAYRR